MRVLVTGGSGFIGTNLVDHYVRSDAKVLNIDIAPPRNPAHRALWVKADIWDSSALRRTVEHFVPEVVLHMPARTNLYGRCIDHYPGCYESHHYAEGEWFESASLLLKLEDKAGPDEFVPPQRNPPWHRAARAIDGAVAL